MKQGMFSSVGVGKTSESIGADLDFYAVLGLEKARLEGDEDADNTIQNAYKVLCSQYSMENFSQYPCLTEDDRQCLEIINSMFQLAYASMQNVIARDVLAGLPTYGNPISEAAMNLHKKYSSALKRFTDKHRPLEPKGLKIIFDTQEGYCYLVFDHEQNTKAFLELYRKKEVEYGSSSDIFGKFNICFVIKKPTVLRLNFLTDRLREQQSNEATFELFAKLVNTENTITISDATIALEEVILQAAKLPPHFAVPDGLVSIFTILDRDGANKKLEFAKTWLYFSSSESARKFRDEFQQSVEHYHRCFSESRLGVNVSYEISSSSDSRILYLDDTDNTHLMELPEGETVSSIVHQRFCRLVNLRDIPVFSMSNYEASEKIKELNRANGIANTDSPSVGYRR